MLMALPSLNLSSCETFTISYRLAKLKLLKPRFGIRRNIGIWPPSCIDPRIAPDLLKLPLFPRPHVLPCPLLVPLPIRFRRLDLPATEVICHSYMSVITTF
jgi:hypothetical protein